MTEPHALPRRGLLAALAGAAGVALALLALPLRLRHGPPRPAPPLRRRAVHRPDDAGAIIWIGHL